MKRFAHSGIRIAIWLLVICCHSPIAFGQEPSDTVRSGYPYPFPGSLEGKELPAFQLLSPDGTQIDSDSLRGSPLLFDFWATWCAPCVKALPELAQLYEETKCKGLKLISIDADHVEGKADQFLAQRHYTWPNYHQTDEMTQLLRVWGFPSMMLVDADGRVLLDHPGIEPADIRNELAKLGPQFTDSKRCSDPEEKPAEASPDPQR